MSQGAEAASDTFPLRQPRVPRKTLWGVVGHRCVSRERGAKGLVVRQRTGRNKRDPENQGRTDKAWEQKKKEKGFCRPS